MRRNLVVLVMLLVVSACGDGRPQVAEPAVPGRAVAAYDRLTGELLWRKEVEPPSAATDPVLAA